jgi:hypothetical protein
MPLSRSLWLAGAVMLIPVGWVLCDDPASAPLPDPSAATSQKDVDRWMQIKLKSSQEVLAGLTRGDFDQVQKSARRMQVISILEQWSKRQGMYSSRSDYEGELNAFDFATKELVREAGQKDTEGTLEAYVNLTRSCVRCHQLIRDVKTAP